jgi:hypothetical protein
MDTWAQATLEGSAVDSDAPALFRDIADALLGIAL